MATLIKETPVLTGKDAVAFIKNATHVTPVNAQERSRIRQNFAQLQAIAKF